MRIHIIIFWAIITFCNLAGYAKGINNMYVQRSSGDETIFFILSQKLPVCKNCKLKNKSIAFDYTYVKKTDSVTMLITVPVEFPTKNFKLDISSDNYNQHYSPDIIYVHPKHNYYEYRLKIIMSFEEFENIYNSSDPFIIDFTFEYGNRVSILKYCYNSNKKWMDIKSKMLQIIDLIKLNAQNNI